jgi:hypothetical protein
MRPRPTCWSHPRHHLALALSLPLPAADHRAPPVSHPRVSRSHPSLPLFTARSCRAREACTTRHCWSSSEPPRPCRAGPRRRPTSRPHQPPPSFSAWPRPEPTPLSLSFSPHAPAGFEEPPAPLFPLFLTLVRAQAHNPPLHSSTMPTTPSGAGAALPTADSRRSAIIHPFLVSAPSEPFLPQLRSPSPFPSLPAALGPHQHRHQPLLRQGHRRAPPHRAATPPHHCCIEPVGSAPP